MPERGRNRPFDEAIPLPRGRELVTLEDAGTYITKLPKAEREALESQAAMEVLILIATSGGPTMSARSGLGDRPVLIRLCRRRAADHWADRWSIAVCRVASLRLRPLMAVQNRMHRADGLSIGIRIKPRQLLPYPRAPQGGRSCLLRIVSI
jgi:hypothetical protein